MTPDPNLVPQPAAWTVDAFPTELLLIRHGQSQAVVPGSSDSLDPPLSDEGHRQAAALAERLAARPLDAVYTSPLARAVGTALPLAEPRRLDVERRDDLREVGLGEWEEGGFRRRAAARDPEFLEFVAAGRWEVIPGAERDDDFRARVRGALDAVVAAHPGESIAVVCHSGVINAWLADHFGSVRSVVATIENTSITTLRAGLRGPNAMNSEGRWLLAGVNDQHHLGDPLLRSPATQAAPGRSSAGASSLASSGETPK